MVNVVDHRSLGREIGEERMDDSNPGRRINVFWVSKAKTSLLSVTRLDKRDGKSKTRLRACPDITILVLTDSDLCLGLRGHGGPEEKLYLILHFIVVSIGREG